MLEQCVFIIDFAGIQFIRNHGWEHVTRLPQRVIDVIGVYIISGCLQDDTVIFVFEYFGLFSIFICGDETFECFWGIVSGIFKTVLCIHYIFSDLIGRVGGMFQFAASFAHIVTGNLYSFLVIISETGGIKVLFVWAPVLIITFG